MGKHERECKLEGFLQQKPSLPCSMKSQRQNDEKISSITNIEKEVLVRLWQNKPS